MIDKALAPVAIFAAAMILLACAANCEAGIGGCRESVSLETGGGAKVAVELEAKPAGEIMVPCSLPYPRNAFVSDGSLETAVSVEDRGGAKFVKLPASLFEKTGRALVRYETENAFDTSEAAVKDFGNIEVKYSFVNGTGEKIDSFETSISLPQGMIVNAVNDYLPKLKKDDARDPFTLSKKAGRRAISLSFAGMKFGDRAALRFSMKAEKRANGVLYIFIIIAIWYLIAFRDVVHPHGEHRDHKKKIDGKDENLYKN